MGNPTNPTQSCVICGSPTGSANFDLCTNCQNFALGDND